MTRTADGPILGTCEENGKWKSFWIPILYWLLKCSNQGIRKSYESQIWVITRFDLRFEHDETQSLWVEIFVVRKFLSEKSLRVNKFFSQWEKIWEILFWNPNLWRFNKIADTLKIQRNTIGRKVMVLDPPNILMIDYHFLCANETPRYYAM